MSELKAYRIKGVTLGDTHDVYLKSEADKVIAELKKACKDKDDWCLHLIKELHHHKYKLCLTMVKYCEYRFMNLEKMIDTEYRTKKMRFSHRWWVKWLKLADKFKEDIK